METAAAQDLDQEDRAIVAAKQAAGIDECLVVELADGKKCAFRRPTSSEWMRYRADSLTQDPQVKAHALQPLVVTCVFYPPREVFCQMTERKPGIVELCGGELVEFAGVERAKKVTRL